MSQTILAEQHLSRTQRRVSGAISLGSYGTTWECVHCSIRFILFSTFHRPGLKDPLIILCRPIHQAIEMLQRMNYGKAFLGFVWEIEAACCDVVSFDSLDSTSNIRLGVIVPRRRKLNIPYHPTHEPVGASDPKINTDLFSVVGRYLEALIDKMVPFSLIVVSFSICGSSRICTSLARRCEKCPQSTYASMWFGIRD